MSQQLILSQPKEYPFVKNIALVLGAAILMGLLGPLAIKLPFSPVPITLGAQMILALSALLGSKRATAAVAIYLAQGAMGLPVFASGGAGLLYMMGPTGGYLLSYLFAAYIVGYLVERMKSRTLLRLFGAMLLGNAIIFLLGVIHLRLFVGAENALMMGLYPFIPGDLLKVIVATKAAHSWSMRP